MVKEHGKTFHFQPDGRGRMPRTVRSHDRIAKHVGLGAKKSERLADAEAAAGHRETAMELYESLRGWMNSMAVPMLVLDAPGGFGKVPLIPSYVQSIDPERVIVKTYRGDVIEYPQPRERDCTVAYDDVQFAGVEPDDDREGST